MVGLDFYVTETTAHCDYILPVTTMYERDDFPSRSRPSRPRRSGRPPRPSSRRSVRRARNGRSSTTSTRRLGGARRRSRRSAFVRKALGRSGSLSRRGRSIDARDPDVQGGDRFGLRRGGLTLRRLAEQHPHGVVRRAAYPQPVCCARRWPTAAAASGWTTPTSPTEIDKLSRRGHPDGYPLRMIGMREPRSENSWMHNSPLLMRGERVHRALIHVDDAAELQIADGDVVRVPLAVRRDRVAGEPPPRTSCRE